jgi:hypothetical protein
MYELDSFLEMDYEDRNSYPDDPDIPDYPDECLHSWVSGMMYVNDEDLDTVAQTRTVECEKCEMVYPRN